MGVLNRQEIDMRLQNSQLLRNPSAWEWMGISTLRKIAMIWLRAPLYGKEGTRSQGNVQTLHYSQRPWIVPQPTLTVQPGQMIFVVTHEDVLMPSDLCGTVYSRNSLALAGILALNAGHVDSGYEGPIVIRLINLRAIPWTLTLGDPDFSPYPFQTTNTHQGDSSSNNRRVSQEEMIFRVRETANAGIEQRVV